MCQLLGMNCKNLTDFNFSFRGFKCRGGGTDVHSHGWGLAIYQGNGVRAFHDDQPANESPLADMVANLPIKTLNMMAHIRYATQGAVSLENVHPFQREMWGIIWTFAHNGEVPKFTQPKNPQQGFEDGSELPQLGNCKQATYHPVGGTDSEAVFCAMLNALRAEFTELPTLPVLYESIQRLCNEIVRGFESETIFNFLLGCGQYTMFAFSWPGSRPGSQVWNGLHYLVRCPPFATAKLKDVDYSVNFSETNDDNDRVSIIATKPLTTNEQWKEFRRGELLMFDGGLPFSRQYECAAIERRGRGLCSRSIPRGQLDPTAYCSNIPQLLKETVCSSIGHDAKSLLGERGADLGCGTGYSHCAFRKLVRHLTGVDLNYEHAKEARDRKCYDRVIVGDVDAILRPEDNESEESVSYDLIYACDLLPYMKNLEDLFRTAKSGLERRGGIFAFSAEIIDVPLDELTGNEQNGYMLQSCARYCHKSWMIEKLVQDFGFEVLAFTKPAPSLREHDGKDVSGAMIVLKQPQHSRL